MQRPLPGLFVAFEGGDGAGKSTQIDRLIRALVERGCQCVVTREPGGTPLGERIRELLLHQGGVTPRAETLLFAADRAHHVETLIRPALARGQIVVSDRYVDSSIAYQGAGRRLDPAQVQRVSLFAAQGLVPDLTVLLDVDPAEGRRRRSVAPDRLESEAADFHARVRAHFLALAAAAPARYLVLDAAQPLEHIARLVRDRVLAEPAAAGTLEPAEAR